MEKSISVRVMGREYTLRVNEEDEAMTREIATYVDSKMTAFRSAFPKQPEITTAVIAALAIAEELYASRELQDRIIDETDQEISVLAEKLAGVLEMPENGLGEGEISDAELQVSNAKSRSSKSKSRAKSKKTK